MGKQRITKIIFRQLRCFIQEAKPTPDLSILSKSLFWDTDINRIDWQRQCRAVIQRVFERGNENDKKEITRYYGVEKINKRWKSLRPDVHNTP
ncbi:DUF6922 domain-containing protein [Parapedobacter composti]|uniref:DUF6922 domain-containing protein n=1 Tax=Parapedobacter composti TaxID=623281 RepID=UPI0037C727E4